MSFQEYKSIDDKQHSHTLKGGGQSNQSSFVDTRDSPQSIQDQNRSLYNEIMNVTIELQAKENIVVELERWKKMLSSLRKNSTTKITTEIKEVINIIIKR